MPRIEIGVHQQYRGWMLWGLVLTLFFGSLAAATFTVSDSDRPDHLLGFVLFKLGIVCPLAIYWYGLHLLRPSLSTGLRGLWRVAWVAFNCAFGAVIVFLLLDGTPFPPSHSAWGEAFLLALAGIMVVGFLVAISCFLLVITSRRYIGPNWFSDTNTPVRVGRPSAPISLDQSASGGETTQWLLRLRATLRVEGNPHTGKHGIAYGVVRCRPGPPAWLRCQRMGCHC
jgi:hypothetical protein